MSLDAEKKKELCDRISLFFNAVFQVEMAETPYRIMRDRLDEENQNPRKMIVNKKDAILEGTLTSILSALILSISHLCQYGFSRLDGYLISIIMNIFVAFTLGFVMNIQLIQKPRFQRQSERIKVELTTIYKSTQATLKKRRNDEIYIEARKVLGNGHVSCDCIRQLIEFIHNNQAESIEEAIDLYEKVHM